MLVQGSAEWLADLRRHARLLSRSARDCKDDVETLIAAAEQDLWQQETDAVHFMAVNVDEARRLLRAHVQAAAARVASARHLLVGARENHAAACRLLNGLDSDDRPDVAETTAVLVVDDHDAIREMVARVLQNAGFVVRTAANGLEGLIAAYEMRPAVIVMDVSMPVLDGIEATRLIKASEATRAARVIAYTGGSLHDTPVSRRLFAAVLGKPASADAVLATVQHVANLEE